MDDACMRAAAGRKALKPHPTHQAKMIAWHLTYRVQLNFGAIPDTEITNAYKRYPAKVKARIIQVRPPREQCYARTARSGSNSRWH